MLRRRTANVGELRRPAGTVRAGQPSLLGRRRALAEQLLGAAVRERVKTARVGDGLPLLDTDTALVVRTGRKRHAGQKRPLLLWQPHHALRAPQLGPHILAPTRVARRVDLEKLAHHIPLVRHLALDGLEVFERLGQAAVVVNVPALDETDVLVRFVVHVEAQPIDDAELLHLVQVANVVLGSAFEMARRERAGGVFADEEPVAAIFGVGRAVRNVEDVANDRQVPARLHHSVVLGELLGGEELGSRPGGEGAHEEVISRRGQRKRDQRSDQKVSDPRQRQPARLGDGRHLAGRL
mmetsp:Transcript_4827/g.11124  ORF Transcript_4827/g.11124 Transcript_4827/m.11124 type:complete len:295 (-) Transcript_4827:85-969(-)